jgi:hypothetical protein
MTSYGGHHELLSPRVDSFYYIFAGSLPHFLKGNNSNTEEIDWQAARAGKKDGEVYL